MRIDRVARRALALALFVVPVAATAGEADFAACDGYPAPRKKSDGIVTDALLWGLVSSTSDFRRSNPTQGLGREAMASCDRALADPLLQPAFAIRRASLLQAKAFHAIHAGEAGEALGILDQSDAAGPRTREFSESLGIGNEALRGLAHIRLGQLAQARTALDRAAVIRPWSASMVRLLRIVRLGGHPAEQSIRAVVEPGIDLDPSLLEALFWEAFTERDFANAVRFGRQITFELPRGRGNWTLEGEEERRYALIEERAKLDGAIAYALQASGDAAAADAGIAAADAALAEAMEAPTPPRSGKLSKRVRADYSARVAAGRKGQVEVRKWAAAIALRRRAPQIAFGAMPGQLQIADATPLALIDLAHVARVASPAEEAERQQVFKTVAARAATERKAALQLDMYELLNLLPRPETVATRPKYQTEGGNFLRSDLNGYAVRTMPGSAMTTVRFGSAIGSLAMVDEAALLAAAKHVRAQGGETFVIDALQSIQRTTRVTHLYYGGGGSSPSGYEVRMGIRILDAAAVAGVSPQRVLKASTLIAALEPRFPPAR